MLFYVPGCSISNRPTDENRLRELRTAKEWLQQDLANKPGVSRQTINAIETEKYDPSLPLALKAARPFKTSIEEIFLPNGVRLVRRKYFASALSVLGRKQAGT